MPKLTVRQQQVLDFIQQTLEEQGSPPTRVEIARFFGFSSANAAEAHLRALAQKGALTLEPGASRGIRLAQTSGLPLVGRVSAGAPILAQEHIEMRLQGVATLFSPRPDYLLKVRGNSMIDVGIFDGDLLAIHRTDQARNGQIIVARLDEEVTVKRFHQQSDGQIQLIAENPDYAPILVTKDKHFAIEGLVVGLIRDSFK